MKIFLKKSTYIVLLIAVVALGGFLRIYNFSDWLHFELDQARDAKVVDLAIEEGIGNLPLLGPKASGSFLRLGPIFYYTEYASAKIFGGAPSTMAYGVLFFSVLTLPLFYFFVRIYFNKNISLGLVLLFSVSLFLIMYSRFAWNPNMIPFFSLLAFYSLLRVVDREEKRKNAWMFVFAITLSIVTQLHFLALVAITAIAFIFLAIKRPKLKLKTWLISLLIVLFFYSPVIINDIKTGGDNAKEFTKVVVGDSKDKKHTLIEKIVRNWTNHSVGYFLVLSGNEKAEFFKFRQLNPPGFDIQCDQGCRDNLLFGFIALVIYTLGAVLLIRNLIKEKDVSRKDFLLLNTIWFFASLVFFIPLAFKTSPRFYLVTAPLAFIFLGLIINLFSKKIKNKNGKIALLLAVVLSLTASNLFFVNKRFSQMEKAATESIKIEPDRILKERNRVTLEQQYLIIDYIADIYKQNNYPVYINSEPFYRRALLYHLDKRDIFNDDFRNTKKVYRNGNYFLVYPTLSNTDKKKSKYMNDFYVAETKKFGTLTVFRLLPERESINAGQQKFEPEKKARSAAGVPIRCRWNEIFSKCNPDEEI